MTYYSLVTFLKKALLLYKMRLIHKDMQKYHLSTSIGMYLEQGLLTDNTEHLQSCETWTRILILLQKVPKRISHPEGGANAIIIKQNVSFLLVSFPVAISDFIYTLNLVTLCKLWPLVYISKGKNMFYFIAIKNSLWMLFIMGTDYNGNFVCGPKRKTFNLFLWSWT